MIEIMQVVHLLLKTNMVDFQPHSHSSEGIIQLKTG